MVVVFVFADFTPELKKSSSISSLDSAFTDGVRLLCKSQSMISMLSLNCFSFCCLIETISKIFSVKC